MIRLLKWLLGIVVALALSIGATIGYVELACTGDGVSVEQAPAILPPEHHRPVTRTFMTYPEWHIVHAYDDYAQVISDGDPHDFSFLRAVSGFWSSLCATRKMAEFFGPVDYDTNLMVYTIGFSFTAELALKAAYEETVGRVFATLRGPSRAALDDLSADQARRYATFLQQVPWYRWDFAADASDLRAQSSSATRDRERAIALGLEYQAKAAYARVIANAVSAVGPDELTLRMIVSGAPSGALAAYPGVIVVAEHEQGVEIETPRYRTLTRLLVDMANDGADFVEIAGNTEIMFTALAPAALDGAVHAFPRQGYRDTRSLILVQVADLAAWLRENPGYVEHIHDY